MTIVVDASLALKWGLQEEHSVEALALWDVWQDAAELLVAPPIFKPEINNALHQKCRRGLLVRSDASEILDFLVSAVAPSEPEGLYNRGLALAEAYGLASTYDALYLALAEFQGCEMWTADRRLVRSVQSRFPLVRWVGEAAEPGSTAAPGT